MRKFRNKVKSLLVVGAAVAGYFLMQGPSDAHIRSRIVRIVSDRGMCSGQQIHAPSGQDYILTAGHCNVLASADGTYTVKTDDGKTLSRRLIGEDPNSDLLLLEGLPGAKGLDIAAYSWQGERVKTYTHGRNLDTYTTEGEYIQTEMIDIPLFRLESDSDKQRCTKSPKFRLFEEEGWCALHIVEEVSTAFISPGSSGGAIVDSDGKLIGVASASDGRGFFYFVTLSDIKSFLRNY